jgi:hypothetical protein
MQTRAWRRYFEANADRPATVLFPIIDDVPPHLVRLLARSLQIFQAGETGEGRIVAEARRLGSATEDDDFVEGLRLYIAEEGRHARELGALVRALGGRASPSHPSADRFRFARRALGFRTKMMVLAGAEVVGGVFYDVLARRGGCRALTRTLDTIVAEERAHLVFQRDYFQALAGRRVFDAALRVTVLAELSYFALEHRQLLRALGVTFGDLLAACEDLLGWLDGVTLADLAPKTRSVPSTPLASRVVWDERA